MTTTGFTPLARFTGKAGGIEDLRVAEYPGPFGIHDEETIARNIERSLIAQIEEGLMQAGTAERETRTIDSTLELVFSGSSDEINRHFIARGWSDGLPIVPPTLARVESFLAQTKRPPHEVIAVLPSANLEATAWSVAVNAVMAGCDPQHMPVLIAAVEALGDERCSLSNIGSSSGIFPFALINGPIVAELGIPFGPQMVSRAPNPAIGRALGLIVRNIAGFQPGASYMGTFGYPLAIAFAESPDSPWPPFHVDQGFSASESTVTIGVTNNWGSSPAPYDTPDKTGAEVALELLSREVLKKTRLFNFPARGPDAEKVMLTMLLSPPVSKSLAEAGYSKADVRQYIYEHARMPLRDFEWVLKYTAIQRTTLQAEVEKGIYPPEFLGAPDDSVRVLSSPDVVHLVVCGDPNRNRVMVMEGGHTQPTTRRIEA